MTAQLPYTEYSVRIESGSCHAGDFIASIGYGEWEVIDAHDDPLRFSVYAYVREVRYSGGRPYAKIVMRNYHAQTV